MKNNSKAWFAAAVAFALIAITVGSIVGSQSSFDPERDCYQFCSTEAPTP